MTDTDREIDKTNADLYEYLGEINTIPSCNMGFDYVHDLPNLIEITKSCIEGEDYYMIDMRRSTRTTLKTERTNLLIGALTCVYVLQHYAGSTRIHLRQDGNYSNNFEDFEDATSSRVFQKFMDCRRELRRRGINL